MNRDQVLPEMNVAAKPLKHDVDILYIVCSSAK